MSTKKYSKAKLLTIILTGFIFFIVFLFCYMSKSPTQSNLATFDKEEILSYGLPVRLKIQSISVDTQIEPVGLTPEGLMDIPKNQVNAAWYEAGPRPGEIGSAVLDGHYGGKTSVFNDLDKLSKGDKLTITDDKSTLISFVVRETRIYDPEADTTAIFSSNDNLSHLNIITCEGTWDKISQSYSGRLVVFTDKVL